MAANDSKSYIVNYIIQANSAGAEKTISSFSNTLTALQEAAKITETGLDRIKGTLQRLKEQTSLTFTPVIEPAGFYTTLRQMVTEVEKAASQMHAAIYQAFTGSPATAKTIQSAMKGAIGDAKTQLRSLKAVREQLQTEMDNLIGQNGKYSYKNGKLDIRPYSGSAYYNAKAKHDKLVKDTKPNQQGVISAEKSAKIEEARLAVDGLKERIREKAAKLNYVAPQIKALEELNKREAAYNQQLEEQKRITATPPAGVASGAKPPKTTPKGTKISDQVPLSNVDREAIEAFGKVFGGKTRSRTLTLGINATKAVASIARVSMALDEMKTKCAVTIAPTVDQTAITNAKKKLEELVKVSKAIANPFTVRGKKGRMKSLNDLSDKVERKITATQNKIAEGIGGSVNAALPKLRIGLDLTMAMKQLNSFIAAIQGKVATLKVTSITESATATAKSVTGGTMSPYAPGKAPMIFPNIPINPALMGNGTSAGAPVGNKSDDSSSANNKSNKGDKTKNKGLREGGNVKYSPKNALRLKNAFYNSMLAFTGNPDAAKAAIPFKTLLRRTTRETGIAPYPNMSDQQALEYLNHVRSMMEKFNIAVPKILHKYIGKLEERIADSMKGHTHSARQNELERTFNRYMGTVPRPDQGWLERQKTLRSRELDAMRADAIAAFATPTPFEQAEQKAAAKQRLDRMRVRLHNQLLPFAGNNTTTLNLLKDNAAFFNQAAMQLGITPSANISALERGAILQRTSALMQSKGVPVPAHLLKLMSDNEKEIAKAVSNYQKTKHAIAENRLSRLQSRLHNQLLPFADGNSSVLKLLKENVGYFNQVVRQLGIAPQSNMPLATQNQILQRVADLMRNNGKAIPTQIPQLIASNEKAMAKMAVAAEASSSKASAAVASKPAVSRPLPLYDRARSWGFPFTGTTSFGSRTPVAVDMAKSMGVMFAIGGAMSAIGSSFSQAMEYQNVMTTTESILKNSDKSYSPLAFKNMENTVRDVGVKTKFSAPEVASAAKFLAMSGMGINDINASIRTIADLALMGDLDLGETADKMTNIMTNFGIAPEHLRQAGNIMFTAATRSNTDLMMLAESAKYAGGVAKMYNPGDPNLFADTMAIFGVLGNAGIQGSSAGTAVRMIYTNLFNPNKKQNEIRNILEQRGVRFKNEDGSNRALSEVLLDIGRNLPKEQAAEIVGKLFRITAQNAAASLIADAQAGKQVDEGALAAFDALGNKMDTSKLGSKLMDLMEANRAAVNGNGLEIGSAAKQNTISGIWAQVTSTFTEGIVKAFSDRQGQFEDMLKGLKDYLARPETVQMLHNLLDLIVEIVKTMAWFAKIWANMYSAAPGLIKTWMTAQMVFTQLGYLYSPFVQLLAVVNRLKSAIATMSSANFLAGIGGRTVALGGASRAAAGGAAAAGAANGLWYAPAFLNGRDGRRLMHGSESSYLKAMSKANGERVAQIASRYEARHNMPMPIAASIMARERLDAQAKAYRKAVYARANRMYGWRNVGNRAFGAWSWKNIKAIFSIDTIRTLFQSLKGMFMGLMRGLASAIGLIANPVTIAIGVITYLGYKIYKLVQWYKGNTEAQKITHKRSMEAAGRTSIAIGQQNAWYRNQLDSAGEVVKITPKSKNKIDKLNQLRKERRARYALLFSKFDKDASDQNNAAVAQKWIETIKANPSLRIAIGKNRYRQYLGGGLTNYTGKYSKGGDYNMLHLQRYNNRAKEIQDHMVHDMLANEGINDPRTQEAIRKVGEKYREMKEGKISYKSYLAEADKIKSDFRNSFPRKVSSAGFTKENFEKAGDLSIYSDYQNGAMNLLNYTIAAKPGTYTGMLRSQMIGKNMGLSKVISENGGFGGMSRFTNAWYEEINNSLSLYPVLFETINAKGLLDQVKVTLSLLPDGTLDYTSIISQVEAKIGEFKGSLHDFSSMIGAVYAKLAEVGAMSLEDAITGAMHANSHKTVTAEDAGLHWDRYIEGNKNSRYYQAMTREQFIQHATGNSKGLKLVLTDKNGNITKTMDGLSSAALRVAMRKTEAKQNVVDNFKQTINDAVGGEKKNGANTAAGPLASAYVPDQSAYGNSYTPGQAKPTQVIMHIDHLAHFDRTMISSSAEEKEMMAAVESKMAEVIYQAFSTASQQAQQNMVFQG